MAETLYGIVSNGVVVPTRKTRLPEGTRVLVLPQPDRESQWLTASQAAKTLGTTPATVRRWVKSGKVRVHADNPRLVRAGDVEDAVEQHELFLLSMTAEGG
jgi:excisionase family DNA binding protein